MKAYIAPEVEVIASFTDTKGLWFGSYSDITGAKAPFPLV